MCKNKYRKDKLETNETGYIKEDGGTGVKRIWEWEWDNRMSEENTTLKIAFVIVVTFWTYLKMNEWMKSNELPGESKMEYKQVNPIIVQINKYTEITKGRKQLI